MSYQSYARALSGDAEAKITHRGELLVSDESDTITLSAAEVLELEKFLRERPAPF